MEGADQLRQGGRRKPSRLADRRRGNGALVRQGRSQAWRDPHRRPRRPAGNNNYKVFEKGAKALGYKEVHTGRMAINSKEYDGAWPASRPASASRAASGVPNGRPPTPTSRRAKRPASWKCAERSHVARILHDDTGKVTGVEYFDKDGKLQMQKARIVCVAGNSFESPRLCSTPPPANLPTALQILRDGRQELHAPHHRLGLCDLRQAGPHVARHDDGRYRAGRGAA